MPLRYCKISPRKVALTVAAVYILLFVCATKAQYRFDSWTSENVWSESPATIRFVVLPPFYQTVWFFALCVLAIGGAAFVVYKIRINRLERARLAHEEFRAV